MNTLQKLTCAEKGAKGQVDERVDTAHVVWSEVIGLCGFWDGSCDNGECEAGFVNLACSKHWAGSLSARNAEWVKIPWMLWYAEGQFSSMD